MLACFTAGLSASAGAEDIELFGSGIEGVLSPGSRLLRLGMHVHDCGDATDIYVTERVPSVGNAAMATRRARLGAVRTIAAFVDGTTGAREQEVVRTETLEGGESVRARIRDRIEVSGVVAGLRTAARVTDGASTRMVFVLPLTGPNPTADCPPTEPESSSSHRRASK